MTAVVPAADDYRHDPLWQMATRVLTDKLPHHTDAARLMAKINAAYAQYGIESGEGVSPALRASIIELDEAIGSAR